jgi:hypothetical protein
VLIVCIADMLWHPERPDLGDHERDIVIRGAQERLGLWSLAGRCERWPTERINTTEQDRQQQPVLDAVQIKHWSPCVEAQPHRSEEPETPRMWQHQAVIRFLEDRRVCLGAIDRPSLIALQRPIIGDCAACLADRGCSTAALAKQIDKPFIGGVR